MGVLGTSEVKKCRVCGIILTSTNWYPSKTRMNSRICNPCEIKEVADYRRKHEVRTSDGKKLWGNKQKKPEDNKCEICDKKARLYYHHLDDQNLMFGMWICTLCHHGAHFIENGFTKKYEELREQREC